MGAKKDTNDTSCQEGELERVRRLVDFAAGRLRDLEERQKGRQEVVEFMMEYYGDRHIFSSVEGQAKLKEWGL